MKLVTFGDDRRVGVLDGEEIAVLHVATMREYFECGGADETGERVALAETGLRAPIVPKKFFHTAGNFREHEEESKQVGWTHEIAPWIVTPDEIPDPHDLAMELRVNGESRQVSHSGRMSVTIPEILSHYSALGYSAGDVLSTGTVSGVAGFSPDAASLYLKPGDVMECEIERIGVLRNPVVSWEEAHGEPAPPRARW